MKVIIEGYISDIWAKRLFTHSQTFHVMGSLSGIPQKCLISKERTEEFTNPITIETWFSGDKPKNFGTNTSRFNDKGA